ncbi:DUF1648 domain-containing protein [Rathayibacter sp. KR2-224]|uniref:DUF1648 domain-containing protein n=1 Tax=Rathayibacter sp. KR2-224 TaxID=3400913 RepID=UPI003C0B8FA7
MTAFVVIFNVAITAVIAAILLAMPSIVRPTLPLGVSVPTERSNDPVVRASVRLYRWSIAAAWVVCAVLGIAGASSFPAVAAVAMPLCFVGLSFAAYVVVRRRIVKAKREGGWYVGKPTRLVADASPRETGHPPIGWLLASLAVVCATVALGVAVYPSLPAVIATHWTAAGRVDATAQKSVWSVFGLPLLGGVISVGLYAISWATRFSPARTAASDTPEQAAARANAQRHLATTGLGILSLALALGFGVTSAASWLAPSTPPVMLAALGVTLLLTIVAVLAIVVAYVRNIGRANGRKQPSGSARVGSPAGVEAPDDDRYWKLGAIYVNSDDPATFVPKRFGVGWTVNLGSAGGIAFAVITVLVVAGSIVAAVIGGASR